MEENELVALNDITVKYVNICKSIAITNEYVNTIFRENHTGIKQMVPCSLECSARLSWYDSQAVEMGAVPHNFDL